MGVEDHARDVRAPAHLQQRFLDEAPYALAQVVARDVRRHVVLERSEDAQRAGFFGRLLRAMAGQHVREAVMVWRELQVGAWAQRRFASRPASRFLGCLVLVQRGPGVIKGQPQRPERADVVVVGEHRADERVGDRPESRLERLRRCVDQRDVRDLALGRERLVRIEPRQASCPGAIHFAFHVDGTGSIRVIAKSIAERVGRVQVFVQRVGVARLPILGRLLKADSVNCHQAERLFHLLTPFPYPASKCAEA